MSPLQKYVFRIRTRNGLMLDNLTVQARDRGEAERRLGQIYHYCEILECQEAVAAARGNATDVEGVIALINETRELPLPESTAAPAERRRSNPQKANGQNLQD